MEFIADTFRGRRSRKYDPQSTTRPPFPNRASVESVHRHPPEPRRTFRNENSRPLSNKTATTLSLYPGIVAIFSVGGCCGRPPPRAPTSANEMSATGQQRDPIVRRFSGAVPGRRGRIRSTLLLAAVARPRRQTAGCARQRRGDRSVGVGGLGVGTRLSQGRGSGGEGGGLGQTISRAAAATGR
ncbi:hypothetical protein DFJ73DRAFT_346708 [Zopfochytrium polystomum]|nr:hypothetical protein DFJ73DRAFT_346708 [Zopfochytrium polystomum]